MGIFGKFHAISYFTSILFLIKIILRIFQIFYYKIEDITSQCILMLNIMLNYIYDILYMRVFK